MLGVFVSAATVSWCFRRSPWAKSAKARRQRNNGDAEQSVLDSYAKMSRRQQKSFAMQATVALLQDSRVRCEGSLRCRPVAFDRSVALVRVLRTSAVQKLPCFCTFRPPGRSLPFFS